MRVLGIETSCDETGVAVIDAVEGLLSHTLYSQVEVHDEFGGVVPELASRDHIRKLVPLIGQTLEAAATTGSGIDGVAYTAGPGLVGALMVGASVARSLAYAWAVNSHGTVTGVYLVVVVIAVLIDLGLVGGSGASARRRRH